MDASLQEDLPRSNSATAIDGMKSTGSFTAVAANAITSFTVDNDAAERYKQICGCRWSGNMRVLLATAVLFMTITSSQYMAAAVSSSKSLLADCNSMAVDSATYFLNIFVETQKGKPSHRILQLILPFISISALTFATIQVLLDAIDTISNPIDPADDEDGLKDAYIVFAFAVFGILFDLTSLYLFSRNRKLRGDKLGINMLAAFAHVGADFARSITTFVESILILFMGFKFTITDAWACCVVSAIILIGCTCCALEWIMDFVRCCKERGQTQKALIAADEARLGMQNA